MSHPNERNNFNPKHYYSTYDYTSAYSRKKPDESREYLGSKRVHQEYINSKSNFYFYLIVVRTLC